MYIIYNQRGYIYIHIIFVTYYVCLHIHTYICVCNYMCTNTFNIIVYISFNPLHRGGRDRGFSVSSRSTDIYTDKTHETKIDLFFFQENNNITD